MREETTANNWDPDDICYECTGYGDDYYEDENGDLVCRCPECPNNMNDDTDW